MSSQYILKASQVGFSMEGLETEQAAKRAVIAAEINPVTEDTEASQ
jgi:hypothetical protein